MLALLDNNASAALPPLVVLAEWITVAAHPARIALAAGPLDGTLATAPAATVFLAVEQAHAGEEYQALGLGDVEQVLGVVKQVVHGHSHLGAMLAPGRAILPVAAGPGFGEQELVDLHRLTIEAAARHAG